MNILVFERLKKMPGQALLSIKNLLRHYTSLARVDPV